jgi:lipopolysaccharide/colanic/teichoic acid biosynthesis glycosyltransferase
MAHEGADGCPDVRAPEAGPHANALQRPEPTPYDRPYLAAWRRDGLGRIGGVSMQGLRMARALARLVVLVAGVALVAALPSGRAITGPAPARRSRRVHEALPGVAPAMAPATAPQAFDPWTDADSTAAGPPIRPRTTADLRDGPVIVSVWPRPHPPRARAAKRAMDVAIASVALLAALPVLAVLGAAIRILDGGPVLFHQRRIGRDGRPFRMLKLRTMAVDAAERLGDLEPHNEVRGAAFKLSRDPRLTRSGAFLRRTSLDELPQLWNVLRGEMSLVGPRPPLPEEVAAYAAWHHRRLSMPPGMTGLWQVSARRHPDFDHWVRLDLAYIDTWSLRLDLAILLRTVPAVLAGDGR